MFWLSYECFSVLCNAFLLKSAISSCNSCAEEATIFIFSLLKAGNALGTCSILFYRKYLNYELTNSLLSL